VAFADGLEAKLPVAGIATKGHSGWWNLWHGIAAQH